MKKSILNVVPFFVIGFLLNFSELNAQCVYPVHNVVISNPGSNASWTSSGSSTTGGTRSKTIQIGTSPDIFMRITWIARSSSAVTVGNWDYTAGGYAASWQPVVTVPRSTSATDTAWAEFKVEFASRNGAGANSFNNNPYTFPCLAMTILDIDGSGNSTGTNAFKETVWVSAPSMPYGITGSAVTSGMIGNWIVNVSGYPVYNNIDSSIHAAQVQMNFVNVQNFDIRAGVIGTRSANATDRQNSFWFLPFGALTVPLPVSYVNQTLTATTNSIVYHWTTATENNNSHFEVQKSTDGVFWNTIGSKQGAGNSYENHSYEFIDNQPLPGYNLYRLKQVDIDGVYQYSEVQKYYWEGTDDNVLIYPNPSNGIVYISGMVQPDIKIFSLATTHIVAESKQSQQIDISNLPNGVYYIELSNGLGSDRIVREKIIKQ